MDGKRFEKLSKVSSDFKVAKNELDIRGWMVIGAHGEKIGSVVDLVFDADKKVVRYLEVNIEVSYPATNKKSILVPSEYATVDKENKIVGLNKISRPLIATYPEYSGRDMDKEYEILIRDFIAGNVNSESELSEDMAFQNKDYQDVSDESLNSTISRLKDERDLAVAERDLAIAEKEKIKRKLDKVLENIDQEGLKNKDYVNCDDFETGRNC